MITNDWRGSMPAQGPIYDVDITPEKVRRKYQFYSKRKPRNQLIDRITDDILAGIVGRSRYYGQWLSPIEAAMMLRFSRKTLENWRKNHHGDPRYPSFIRDTDVVPSSCRDDRTSLTKIQGLWGKRNGHVPIVYDRNLLVKWAKKRNAEWRTKERERTAKKIEQSRKRRTEVI